VKKVDLAMENPASSYNVWYVGHSESFETGSPDEANLDEMHFIL
jgi:hypothetical protein